MGIDTVATRYITKIGVLSFGKIFGIIYAMMGLILGAIMSIMFMIVGPVETGSTIENLMFGVGSIIVLPITYGIIGFIGGIITAFIYNIAVGFTGGLKIEVESSPVPE